MVHVMASEIIHELREGMDSGSIVSILYDTYSLGWVFGFELFRSVLSEGFLGVIHNYSLPYPRLISRASFVNLNIPVEASRDRLRILDIFGSRYNVPVRDPYILRINNPNEDTLAPKIEKIYHDEIYPLAQGGIVKLVYTLDGTVVMFGEKSTIKLLNSEMSFLARESIRRRVSEILLLNTSVVSDRLVAWISSVSDTMVVFRSKFEDDVLLERMIILKTPSPEFEQVTYGFKVSTENGNVHALHFEKLS